MTLCVYIALNSLASMKWMECQAFAYVNCDLRKDADKVIAFEKFTCPFAMARVQQFYIYILLTQYHSMERFEKFSPPLRLHSSSF